VPFEGSTKASGAMAYLPGSHAIGMRKFVNTFFGEPEDILADPEVADAAPDSSTSRWTGSASRSGRRSRVTSRRSCGPVPTAPCSSPPASMPRRR